MEVRRLATRLDQIPTLVALSTMAASLANDPESETLRRATLEPLLRLKKRVHPQAALVGDYVSEHRDGSVIHEQVLVFLQALVILVSGPGGKHADDGDIAFLALAANDHLRRWEDEGQDGLGERERILADLTHISRFNRFPDPLRSLSRAAVLFSRRPSRGPYSGEAAWEGLQREAFGLPFAEYFETFVVPLMMMAQTWGTLGADGKPVPPILRGATWFASTLLGAEAGRAFLQELALGLDAMRPLLKTRTDGLPLPPLAFVKHPLVEIEPDVFVVLSPRVLAEQLRLAPYMRLMRAAKARGDAEDWSRSFGVTFETMCAELAVEAAALPGFSGRVLVPREPGAEDEIEDVVIADGARAVMFSAKSRLVKELVARSTESRAEIVKWHEEFFFGDRTDLRRAGAVRLLAARVGRVLAGEWPAVAVDRVFPTILTYDNLAENAALYRWLDERCREEGLLQDPRIAPLTVMSIDEYEAVLSLATRGVSVTSFMAQKTETAWRAAPTNWLVHELGQGEGLPRLPSQLREFDALTDRCVMRLWGHPKRREQ
jgi:hypothetical protein